MTSFSAAQRSRVTMLDVAQRAGVSKASVSRFIGDDRALLSDAIALRIEQAIDELGYRPNQMARGLKRGRTRLIGMLVADIRNPYSIAVMHGVETACRRHGYSLVVCNTDRDDEQERQHLAALRAYNLEGLIVNTLGHHLEQLLELQREMPLVLVDRKVDALHSDLVGLDNPRAVGMALDHLEQQGYREILLVSEVADGTSSRIERMASMPKSVAATDCMAPCWKLALICPPVCRHLLPHPRPAPKPCSVPTASPHWPVPQPCARWGVGCSRTWA